jgi:thiol-disulfide isomerase/thioredoxin
MRTKFALRLIIVILCLLPISELFSQGVYDIETKDLNGNISSIGEVTIGNIIVLDFWATWCKPCVKSIPKLVKLSEKFDTDKVSFVGINEDSPRNINKVKPFVSSYNISYPVLLDAEQEIMSDLLVSSFPTLIILDAEANILFVHEGYTSGDEILIEKELTELLESHD